MKTAPGYRVALFFACLFCAPLPVFAFGNRDASAGNRKGEASGRSLGGRQTAFVESIELSGAFPEPDEPGERISAQGRIMVRGNEPFSYVCFRAEDDERTYVLYPEKSARFLQQYQGLRLELELLVPLDAPEPAIRGFVPGSKNDIPCIPLVWKVIE